MSSLLALLAQQTPNLQTRKGLILLGLQNDFLSPDGKLPVSKQSGYLDRLKELVPAFREFGDVIWVRSEFEASRAANVDDENGDTVIAGSAVNGSPTSNQDDMHKRKASQDVSLPLKRMKATEAEDDPELFLTRTSKREPCCVKGSWGAEYPDDIKELMDKKDMQVVKTYYSAFGSTSLLLTLRSKLITEIFVCGCNTNLSVFATAMDAARYGISITLIEDCLGYRKRERHEEAVRQLVNIMGADVMSSKKVVDVLKNPPEDDYEDEDEEEEEEEEEEDEEDSSVLDADWMGLSKPSTTVQESVPLVADSDDDENGEDEEIDDLDSLTSVRSLRHASVGLALRYASSSSRSSRSIASIADRPPAQPPSSRPPSSGSIGGNHRKPSGRTNNAPRSRDGSADVESKVPRSSGHRGLSDPSKVDAKTSASVQHDAPSRVRRTKPWLDMLDSSATTSADTPKQSPRCSHPGLAALSSIAGLSQQTVDDYAKAMEAARRESASPEACALRSMPLFGENKKTESAGSKIQYNLLPPELADSVFNKLNHEVKWQHMHHHTGEVPRLVCCQGTIAEDGSMPVYRHPSDQTLPLQAWTSTVKEVRKRAEEAVGQQLNHVLIQLYRGGNDYISEHSDKTLDIMKGSNIVNVSFGAQRTMRLRTKRGAQPLPAAIASNVTPASSPRTTYRVPMPHNSMITMSLATNAEYLHGINADKRPAVEFADAEKAYEGQRISLTFRHIGTYLSADSKRIWGQGAIGKSENTANAVINGDASESEKLVRAFGAENQASSIDWETVYGEGSDVLHLK